MTNIIPARPADTQLNRAGPVGTEPATGGRDHATPGTLGVNDDATAVDAASTRRSAYSAVAEIRAEQQAIRRQIAHVEGQLKRLERIPLAQQHSYVTFERVSLEEFVERARKPQPPLSQLLEQDLVRLRRSLKELQSRARRTVAREEAATADLAFDLMMEAELRRAEKTGSLDPSRMVLLERAWRRAVRAKRAVLKAEPTYANARELLEELGRGMSSGFDTDGVDGQGAVSDVTEAAVEWARTARKEFRAIPSKQNLGRFLNEARRVLAVGGGDRIDLVESPPRRVKQGNTRVVERGDTLSGISEEYYGSPSYWDVIYFENHGVIGDDPDRPRIGATLTIP